jgi:hypothetical protein
MIKFKKPASPKQEEDPSGSSSLAAQIRAAQNRAAQVIESEAQRIKKSPEGELLPIDWIRLNIRAIARAGSCDCKCALSLLEDQK